MAATPKLYLARAGRNGEDEDLALENNLAIIDFRDVPSLEGAVDYDAVAGLVNETFPDLKPKTRSYFAGQLWAFSSKMKTGDLVVLPQKLTPQVAIGRVTGPYEYREVNAQPRHIRPVEWLKMDLARSTFEQDLLHSFRVYLSVYNISRNDAVRRIPSDSGRETGPRPISPGRTENQRIAADRRSSRGRPRLGPDGTRPDRCADPVAIRRPRIDAVGRRRTSDRRLDHESLSPRARRRRRHSSGPGDPRARRPTALRPSQIAATLCGRHRLQNPSGHDADIQCRAGAARVLGEDSTGQSSTRPSRVTSRCASGTAATW